MNSIECNICIIGAGIVGLSIAKELASQGHKDIVVLDKEKKVACHASGRNSGVLHAGVYYPSDSLKAKFCLEGNTIWKQFCLDNDLPLFESGKVIVCKNEKELETLHMLYERAEQNGAKVDIINESKLAQIEPLAKTFKQAIMSYSTAVIDPKVSTAFLKQYLQEKANITFQFNTYAIEIVSENTLITSTGNVIYQFLINASGSDSDRIAHTADLAKQFRLIPFKGKYKKLKESKKHLINSNIYPVPDLRYPFLGIHFTTSIHGDVYIGPTAIPAFGGENYRFFEGLSKKSLRILSSDIQLFFQNQTFRNVAYSEMKSYINSVFYKAAKSLVHELHPSDIVNSEKVGIRPQLVNWKTKELVMDFLIEKTDNSLHVLNAISPAWTCAPSFAKYIVQEYF